VKTSYATRRDVPFLEWRKVDYDKMCGGFAAGALFDRCWLSHWVSGYSEMGGTGVSLQHLRFVSFALGYRDWVGHTKKQGEQP